jgi:hypothetical protein
MSLEKNLKFLTLMNLSGPNHTIKRYQEAFHAHILYIIIFVATEIFAKILELLRRDGQGSRN